MLTEPGREIEINKVKKKHTKFHKVLLSCQGKAGWYPTKLFKKADPGLKITPPSPPNLPADLGRHAGSGIQSPAGGQPSAPIAIIGKWEGHLCHGEDDHEPWCFITTSTPRLPPHVVEQHRGFFQQGKPSRCSSPNCQIGRLTMWWTERTLQPDWERFSAPFSWCEVSSPVDRAWSPSRAMLQFKFYWCRAAGRFGFWKPATGWSTPRTKAIQTSSCFSPSGALMSFFTNGWIVESWKFTYVPKICLGPWRLDRGQVSKRGLCGCTSIASMNRTVILVLDWQDWHSRKSHDASKFLGESILWEPQK